MFFLNTTLNKFQNFFEKTKSVTILVRKKVFNRFYFASDVKKKNGGEARVKNFLQLIN